MWLTRQRQEVSLPLPTSSVTHRTVSLRICFHSLWKHVTCQELHEYSPRDPLVNMWSHSSGVGCMELSGWNPTVLPGALAHLRPLTTGPGFRSVLHPWLHNATGHPDPSLVASPSTKVSRPNHVFHIHFGGTKHKPLGHCFCKAWEPTPPSGSSFPARHRGLHSSSPWGWKPFSLCPHAPHTLLPAKLSISASEKCREKELLHFNILNYVVPCELPEGRYSKL